MDESKTTLMIQQVLDHYMNQTGVNEEYLHNLTTVTKIPENSTPPMYCGQAMKDFRISYLQVHGYISLMVCLFGMLANTMNIIVLTRKDMISPTNAILTGLALADNLVMIDYIVYAVHNYILVQRSMEEKYSYPWAVYVLIHSHFTQVFHTISIWLTLTLAVWRYLSVAHPLSSRGWCTLNRALIAIAIAYIGSPILCIPTYLTYTIRDKNIIENNPLFPESNETVKVYLVDESEMAKNNKALIKINFWTYSVIVKIIPCLALTILSYCLVSALVNARERRDQLKRNRSATKNSSSGGEEGEGRHTDRTTIMLLAILILFLITEIPQGILVLLSGILDDDDNDAFFRNCYTAFNEVMDILALINGAINFILYCAMSRQFRQTFIRLFRPRILDNWSALPLQPVPERRSLMQRTHTSNCVKDTNLNIEQPPTGVWHCYFHLLKQLHTSFYQSFSLELLVEEKTKRKPDSDDEAFFQSGEFLVYHLILEN